MRSLKGKWEKRQEELLEYCNQGLSSMEIAEKFNCSSSTIYRVLRRLGIYILPSSSINWEDEKINLEKLLNEGRSVEYISDLYDISESILRRHLKELGLKKNRSNLNSRCDDIEMFKRAVMMSKSLSDVCVNLNLRPLGGNIGTVRRRIENLNLDISHFDYGKSKRKRTAFIGDEKLFSKINPLVNSRSYSSGVIKSRLLKNNYRDYKCECCGNTEWNGKPIPLQLHHKDGDHTNNELTNLQLLCPNCHAQTDNYCRRSKNSPSRNP